MVKGVDGGYRYISHLEGPFYYSWQKDITKLLNKKLTQSYWQLFVANTGALFATDGFLLKVF